VIQLFVTGTDTGVGKTTVACALLAAARARGLRVLAIKPVETGCAMDPDTRSLRPADAMALERACRDPIAARVPATLRASEATTARERATRAPAAPLENATFSSSEPTTARERATWAPAIPHESANHRANEPTTARERATLAPDLRLESATDRANKPTTAREQTSRALAAPLESANVRAIESTPAREQASRALAAPLESADARAIEPTPAREHAGRALAPPLESADDRAIEPAPLSTVYRFAAPLAPSVAAELVGDAVALAPILRAVDRLRSLAPDLLLVEGAGGLLVPLSESTDMADLAAALAAPLLVVARDGLGTINHTLLTLEAAAARGLRVAGVVLCAADAGTSDRDAARNAEEIERRGRVPVLGRLGHLPDLELSTLAESAQGQLRLDPLLLPRH
jgi:dethiobiotin synthase